MHMRYGILDVSAGEESLTTLFFSDMHPHAHPAALSYKAAGIFFCTNAPAGGNTGGGVLRVGARSVSVDFLKKLAVSEETDSFV